MYNLHNHRSRPVDKFYETFLSLNIIKINAITWWMPQTYILHITEENHIGSAFLYDNII